VESLTVGWQTTGLTLVDRRHTMLHTAMTAMPSGTLRPVKSLPSEESK
jgi:hypothetical protein